LLIFGIVQAAGMAVKLIVNIFNENETGSKNTGLREVKKMGYYLTSGNQMSVSPPPVE